MSQIHRGEGLTIGKGNVCEQKPAVLADL